jgi:hypothetical protein
MKSTTRARVSGMIGMVSAGLWLVALWLEYRYHLQPPGDGSPMYLADQVIFFIALIGYLTVLLGLWGSSAAGDGIFAKISVGIFIAGLASLVVAQVVQLLTNNPDFFLFPVGGICQLVGGLLTGIAVVTARRWDGWQRFAPMLQGLFYLIALFIPLAISNQSPTPLGESLWQITWFITSLALFTMSSPTARRLTTANAKP